MLYKFRIACKIYWNIVKLIAREVFKFINFYIMANWIIVIFEPSSSSSLVVTTMTAHSVLLTLLKYFLSVWHYKLKIENLSEIEEFYNQNWKIDRKSINLKMENWKLCCQILTLDAICNLRKNTRNIQLYYTVHKVITLLCCTAIRNFIVLYCTILYCIVL